jgi:hypothetical protein
MENMREYWAREAEMMRDKSAVLGTSNKAIGDSTDSTFTLFFTIQSFAPFDRFGALPMPNPASNKITIIEFKGDGNGRKFGSNTGLPSKLSATTELLIGEHVELVKTIARNSESIGYLNTGGSWTAVSETRILESSLVNDLLSLKADAGNDAALVGLDTDIGDYVNMNIDHNASILFDTKKTKLGTELRVTGSTFGDRFPSAESFLSDKKGNSVILGVSPIKLSESINKDLAPYKMLLGKNERLMSSFSLTLRIDTKGDITGVIHNNKTYTIAVWNAQFINQPTVIK